MILEKNFLFFKSARIFYQGENIESLMGKYEHMAVISYKPLSLQGKGFRLTHKKIANIYLEGSIDDVFKKFSVSTRNEIHKTEKIKELTFVSADDNFKKAYKLYYEFEKLQGRRPWKRNTFRGTILFNAYFKGELIATISCYDLHPHLQIKNISSRRLSVNEKKLYKIVSFASRRLIYEVCKYGKKKGYIFVGLGAVNSLTAQKTNVSKFKMFFAPRIDDEYTYVYRGRKFLFLNSIRNFIFR